MLRLWRCAGLVSARCKQCALCRAPNRFNDFLSAVASAKAETF
jgi:hypothetical protein